MSHDPSMLPAHLPAPVDDGAARHLAGLPVPRVPLPGTNGESVDLNERSQGRRLVVFVYPKTGRTGVQPPAHWDEIPGARGCTPEACSFRDLFERFALLHTDVYGLSAQDTAYQQEAASRLQLPYVLLSDADHRLAAALHLPTFTAGGETLLRRLTVVIDGGCIQHVLYPVFPPERAAHDVLTVLGS
jgi:peroxiredoxin